MYVDFEKTNVSLSCRLIVGLLTFFHLHIELLSAINVSMIIKNNRNDGDDNIIGRRANMDRLKKSICCTRCSNLGLSFEVRIKHIN